MAVPDWEQKWAPPQGIEEEDFSARYARYRGEQGVNFRTLAQQHPKLRHGVFSKMKRANKHSGRHAALFETRFVGTAVEHTRKSGVTQRIDNMHFLNDAGRRLLKTKSNQKSKQALVMVWKYPTLKKPSLTVKCTVRFGDLGDDQAIPHKLPTMTLEIFGTHARDWTPPAEKRRKIAREVSQPACACNSLRRQSAPAVSVPSIPAQHIPQGTRLYPACWLPKAGSPQGHPG